MTPARAGVPEDPEGEWPEDWDGIAMPALIGVALADRFGIFEFQVPEWAASWSP